jgi:hypothetical protein
MTDRTSPHIRVVPRGETVVDQEAPSSPGRRSQRRRPTARARVVVAGMGFTAMLALVGTMEVSEGHTRPSAPPPSSASTSPKAVVVVHQGAVPASIKAAAGVSRRPIVLTAHAIVRTVKSPATGGSGGYVAASSSGGSGYVSTSGGASSQAAAPAPAPAAAPVASTSGSH